MTDKKSVIEKIKKFKTETLAKLSKENIVASKKRIIKKIKDNRSKILVGFGISATLAFSFKSDQSQVFNLDNLEVTTNDITLNAVVLDGDTITYDDFYRNAQYKNGEWRYIKDEKVIVKFKVSPKPFLHNERHNDRNLFNVLNKSTVSFDTIKGKNIKIADRISNEKYTKDRIRNLEIIGMKEKNDTIPVSYKTEFTKDSTEVRVMCSIEGKNVKNTKINSSVTYGYHCYGTITMNYYKVDPELNEQEQEKARKEFKRKYNIELDNFDAIDHNKPGGDKNKVFEHEAKHYRNNLDGTYTYGLKPEQTYTLRMHDEVSANIEQFLHQREAYLETGDLNSINNRFYFYKKAVKDKKIQPRKDNISTDEVKIIAEGTREMWDKHSRTLYRKQVKDISKQIINKSLKTEATNVDEMYKEILDRMYTFETKNGQILKMNEFIEEFKLNDYDKETIAEIKKNRETNEADILARIEYKHGRKALNAYINKQKEIVQKKDQEAERRNSSTFAEYSERHFPYNKEANIEEERRVASNRFMRRRNKQRC